MDETTILHLLERLQKRDSSALDELLPHVLQQVRRSYAKKLPDHILAEMDDFLGEISLRLVKDYYRSAQNVNQDGRFAGPNQFWAYVHAICRNTSTDLFRYANAKRRQAIVEGGSVAGRIPSEDKTASHMLKDQELFDKALAELQEDERQAFEAQHHGFSRKEIADMMDRTVEDVRYLLRKATEKLAKNGRNQSSYF
ncbi:MAG: sigma-70 family RNA polymerase sigma factor [Planctomycetales bacterium]|nr:sigma-70 family RNA polymerase sigma factor [Planctomycetales bacterium]